jgi:hypothetical protein
VEASSSLSPYYEVIIASTRRCSIFVKRVRCFRSAFAKRKGIQWVGRIAEYFFAEIAQLPNGTYYVSLTGTSVDDEEPQLLNQEIDSRRGVSLDEMLAVIKSGLTGSN